MQASHNEMAPRKGRLFLYSLHFWIPIAIMAFAAMVFNLFDLDLRIQSFYYQDGWRLDNLWWVDFLYHYGNIPAIIVAVGGLLIYLRSFSHKSSLLLYRKMALFLSLAMIIGPGIIVNSILKDNWGRPRPRELELYGGRYSYEAPLNIDPESQGKSFPCGHATMGFYFFAPAFLMGLMKRRYYLLLTLFAISYGSLIGWVRIIQGGHFTSDVIFAGAIVYLSSYLLWKLLKMDVHPYYKDSRQHVKLKPWQVVLSIVGIVILLLGISLATPYTTRQNLSTLQDGDYVLQIGLSSAFVKVNFGDSLYVSNDVYAFGFPGSKARLNRVQLSDTLRFEQRLKGFFSEFQASVEIGIDTLRTKQMDLVLEEGELELNLPESLVNKVYYTALDASLDTIHSPADSVSAKYNIRSPRIEFTDHNK